MNNWKVYNVQELIDLGMLDKPMDGNHGSIHPKATDYVLEGVPFIMANNLVNGEVEYSASCFITEEQAKKLRKGFAINGDVLLTHKGTIGRTAFVRDEYDYIILTPQITYYRVIKGIDRRYLKYYFDSEYFQQVLMSWASSGSTRAYIGVTEQRKLPIVLPPLYIQNRIADILYSMDNKITLNNKLNEKLLDLMSLLFQEWFVKGGKMEQKPLYELAKFVNGTSFKSNEYVEEGIPIIKIAELKNGITQATQYFRGEKDEKYYIKNGDILFSWSGNPETSIDTFIWYDGNGILNQHTFKVVPKENEHIYIYMMLKFFKPTFTSIASDKQTTGLGHVTVADLKRLTFNYDEVKVKEFNALVEPLYKKFYNNYIEKRNLELLRNVLLQELISGEINLHLGSKEL